MSSVQAVPWSVHGLSNFPNSPIDFAVPSCYGIRSNHNLLLNVPFSYSNSYFYSSFCADPRVWNTMPYTQYFHFKVLIYSKVKVFKQL